MYRILYDEVADWMEALSKSSYVEKGEKHLLVFKEDKSGLITAAIHLTNGKTVFMGAFCNSPNRKGWDPNYGWFYDEERSFRKNSDAKRS